MSVRASVGGKEYHRRLDPDELIKLRLSLGIVFNDYDTTVGARRKSASEFATKSLLPALATVGKCRVSMDNGECIVTFSVPLEDYGQIKGRLSLPQAHAVLEPLCMTLAREAKRLKWSVEQLQRKLHDAEILLEAAKSNRSADYTTTSVLSVSSIHMPLDKHAQSWCHRHAVRLRQKYGYYRAKPAEHHSDGKTMMGPMQAYNEAYRSCLEHIDSLRDDLKK
ncbi:hypothetical protein FOZ60_009897 [Perkinsus olseni]|uniref:Uncharacterized protein n=1 Tax=Perkinsus olseni TaxID=32597 RepID=A0A7J6PMB3_PEROL|nr:hypothetical protein FOZ60_009897 [Perkinsus olseni]